MVVRAVWMWGRGIFVSMGVLRVVLGVWVVAGFCGVCCVVGRCLLVRMCGRGGRVRIVI